MTYTEGKQEDARSLQSYKLCPDYSTAKPDDQYSIMSCAESDTDCSCGFSDNETTEQTRTTEYMKHNYKQSPDYLIGNPNCVNSTTASTDNNNKVDEQTRTLRSKFRKVYL